tara:strand:- start:389 stop:556 length:168 start_codon:yes stop_codon:yes gene_type:complete
VNNTKKIEKHALWLTADMHKVLKDFAYANDMKINTAGEFLIKLAICQHELEKKND